MCACACQGGQAGAAVSLRVISLIRCCSGPDQTAPAGAAVVFGLVGISKALVRSRHIFCTCTRAHSEAAPSEARHRRAASRVWSINLSCSVASTTNTRTFAAVCVPSSTVRTPRRGRSVRNQNLASGAAVVWLRIRVASAHGDCEAPSSASTAESERGGAAKRSVPVHRERVCTCTAVAQGGHAHALWQQFASGSSPCSVVKSAAMRTLSSGQS